MQSRFVPAILSLLCAFPLLAQTKFTITPRSGPASGGTTVTIKGDFAEWPYGVIFDKANAVSTTRIDEHTLVAVTPPHPPGVSNVIVFEYDFGLATGLTFEFQGERERLLLPLFVPPVRGAFGSEFRTELHGINTGHDVVTVYGFDQECFDPPCSADEGIELESNGVDIAELRLLHTGNPGRFLYLPAEDAPHFSSTLRVYDTSRSAENFGTEIPIVRGGGFRRHPFALVHVPLDPQFRKTLRLYAYEATTAIVSDGVETHEMALQGGDTYLPAYAMFTDFRTGTGSMDITVIPNGKTPVWGFISVTNNDTQHITVITPR
jgi:hypothetical protein